MSYSVQPELATPAVNFHLKKEENGLPNWLDMYVPIFRFAFSREGSQNVTTMTIGGNKFLRYRSSQLL